MYNIYMYVHMYNFYTVTHTEYLVYWICWNINQLLWCSNVTIHLYKRKEMSSGYILFKLRGKGE